MDCKIKSPTSVLLSALLTTMPSVALAASASSDALILLDPDGRRFTAQYTIASDGPVVSLALPATGTPRQVSFLGSNQRSQEEGFESGSSTVQLWNGVALVRYEDQYSDEVQQIGPHTYRLTLPSLPMNFAVEEGDITRSSMTWVFPESLELISYSAVADDVGTWQLTHNELSYEQYDRFAITLTIEYSRKENYIESALLAGGGNADAAREAFCVPTASDPDRCADDTDQDGVPDYRDVCLPTATSNEGQDLNETTAAENLASVASQQETVEVTDNVDKKDEDEVDLFGCDAQTDLVLDEIRFPSGYSYLDVPSRQSLDRLALALQQNDHYFEIGSHTDNAGRPETNLALSSKRAEAVRYYLLLRGVDPNRIRSKGYGEQYPIADNATAEGRQANRRVEITLLE